MAAIYLWQPLYHAAVFETDPAQRPIRYYEALAAIEQRLLSIVDKDSEEFRALATADHAIQSLRRDSLIDTRK